MEVKTSGSVVSTGVNVEKLAFTWRIKNYDLVRQSTALIYFQEVKFQIGRTSEITTDWCFHLTERTKREGEEETKWIGMRLRLERAPLGLQEVIAAFRVRIMKEGSDGGVYAEFRSIFQDYVDMDGATPNNGWVTSELIPQSAQVTELPLTDGYLIAEVEIHVLEPMPVATFMDDVGSLKRSFKQKFAEKLQKDLGKVLTKSELRCHVPMKIVSKDNKEFPVNGDILSARSGVFEKMLETKMKEYKTGNIEITDLSSKTIGILLRFMTTGTLQNNWADADVIVELVYAADKYQLDDLIEFLDQALGFVCSKETVGKLLNIARKISLKNAEKDLFEYMKTNVATCEDMINFGKDLAADVIF